MRRTTIASVLAILMASIASATTVWNPAANGIVPPAVGNWNDGANWTNGVPQDSGSAEFGKVVFNVTDASEAQVTDAQAFWKLVQGDNGPGGVIRVQSGGSLSTDTTWSSVGWNNPANLVIEAGGSVSFGGHGWIGPHPGGAGVIDIEGGTFSIGSMLGLGTIDAANFTGGTGIITVNDGGTFHTNNIHGGGTSIWPGSSININGSSQMTIDGDKTGTIDNQYGAYIFGNGVAGNVLSSYDASADLTTVVAIPEPGTMLLLGLGLGGLLIGRRR